MFGHLLDAGFLKLVGYSTALTFLSITAYVIYNLFVSPLRSYPGPWLNAATPIPFLYHLLKGNQCQYFEDLHNQYGDVVRVTPNQLSYVAADAWKDVYERRPGHALLEKEPNFYLHPGDNVPSIVTAPRNIHIRMRRLYSHAFSEKALRDQEPLINNYVDLLIRRLAQESSKGNAVDIVRYYNWTAFDIIGDLALGEPFGCLKEGSDHPWIEATFASIKVAPMAFVGACFPSIGPYMRSFIPPSITKALEENFKFTTDKVRARLERKTDRADFMSRIIEHNDADGMTGAEIESTSNHVIIGGGETTATALSGITFNLLKNEEVMAKLKHEIRTSFSSPEDITLTRLTELPYMAAVINESLRHYPPFAGSFPRIVPDEGEVILGRPVPGKTVVSVHHWATYHNKKNFHRAEDFVPERFLGDPEFDSDSTKSFQPFLVGPRACIGKNLALFEIRIILAKLLFNFDLTLQNESKSWITGQKNFLAFEKPPLRIKLTPVPGNLAMAA
ncbi:hypothetical protein SEUCBS140593_005423 [Sporothrix eucalyptigena]|uniref:Cytochrome P450 n=1 Tax=Sporothrix eucalyptigena TaxID=1812306 RepID=A0ABP0BY29_9PEZI